MVLLTIDEIQVIIVIQWIPLNVDIYKERNHFYITCTTRGTH